MAVRIINSEERLEHKVGDTTFYYKRITTGRANAIRRKYTKRGEIDAGAVGMEILYNYLLGWSNVLDWDDKQVEFTPENLVLIPDETLADVLVAIGSADGNEAINAEQASVESKPEKIIKNS